MDQLFLDFWLIKIFLFRGIWNIIRYRDHGNFFTFVYQFFTLRIQYLKLILCIFYFNFFSTWFINPFFIIFLPSLFYIGFYFERFWAFWFIYFSFFRICLIFVQFDYYHAFFLYFWIDIFYFCFENLTKTFTFTNSFNRQKLKQHNKSGEAY